MVLVMCVTATKASSEVIAVAVRTVVECDPQGKTDERHNSEDIVINTPGDYIGHNRFDPANNYPIKDNDFATTFEELYPMRPNFNMYTECSSCGTCNYETGECKCFGGFEGGTWLPPHCLPVVMAAASATRT